MTIYSNKPDKQKVLSPKKEGKITWGELKKLLEQAGINESDEIDAIDISWGSIDDVKCEKDEDFGWQIHL